MRNVLVSLLVVFIFSAVSHAQGLLKGKVVDEKSIPIAGASVHLLNTDVFTVTNSDGRFLLQRINQGSYLLNVSSVGFASAITKVTNDSINEILVQLSFIYKQLSEVTVVTQKTDELLQNLPISITSLSGMQVEDYRLWNLRDLSALSPNLYTADPGDKRNVTSIRGIVSTSYDPAVASYIDGVNQFGLDTYIAQLFDVDRIEIARGPQGTLYGRNAMGGVINIITRKPENKVSGFVEAALGEYGQQRFVSGIRLPLLKDKLYFGAAALFEKSNGFYQNVYINNKYDKQHSFTGNYYLRYIPNASWSFTINAKHAANRNNGTFPLVFGTGEALEKPFMVDQNAVAEMVDNIANSSLSINYSGRKINIASQISYQSNYRFYKSNIDADFSPLDAISIYNNFGKDWNNVQVFTQEVRFSSKKENENKLNWLTGAYAFRQHNPVKQATRFGSDATQLAFRITISPSSILLLLLTKGLPSSARLNTSLAGSYCLLEACGMTMSRGSKAF